MKHFLKAFGLLIGIGAPCLAAPTSGPAGNFIINTSTIAAATHQQFSVYGGTVTKEIYFPYLTTGQCQTTDATGKLITVPCGSGAAAVAVTTGNASGFNTVRSSPTAVINFDSTTFNVGLEGGATAFISLSQSYLTTSSATATYLQSSSATATYLQASSATVTYLTQSSATATYFPNSGVLAVAHGGTGTSSPGLIAGTNITSITGSWPNQTINAATQAGGGSGPSGQINTASQYSAGYYSVTGSSNVISGIAPVAGNLVLTSSGTAGPPYWAASSGGSSTVLLSSGIAFGSATNTVTSDTNTLTYTDSTGILAVKYGITAGSGTFTGNLTVNGAVYSPQFFPTYGGGTPTTGYLGVTNGDVAINGGFSDIYLNPGNGFRTVIPQGSTLAFVSSNGYVGLIAPPSQSSTPNFYVLPSTQGVAGQALTLVNSTGTTAWSTIAGGGSVVLPSSGIAFGSPTNTVTSDTTSLRWTPGVGAYISTMTVSSMSITSQFLIKDGAGVGYGVASPSYNLDMECDSNSAFYCGYFSYSGIALGVTSTGNNEAGYFTNTYSGTPTSAGHWASALYASNSAEGSNGSVAASFQTNGSTAIYVDAQAGNTAIRVQNGNEQFNNLTASQFVQTDTSKNLISYDLFNASPTYYGAASWLSASPSTFTATVNVGGLTGASLSSCNSGSNALTWNAGQFGCNTITGGGSGGGGNTQAGNQFSAPYYNVAGSSTSLAAFPGITLSTNTGVAIATHTVLGAPGFAVLHASNTIMPGTTFYQNGQAVINGVNSSSWLTGNQSITLSGDSSGSGTTAITVTAAASQPNITSISSKLLLGAASNSVSISSNAITPSATFYYDGSIAVGSGVGTSGNTCISGGKITTAGCANGTLTSNQTITLSGDATGSGTTAITVSNAALQPNIKTFSSSITVNNSSGLLVDGPVTAGVGGYATLHTSNTIMTGTTFYQNGQAVINGVNSSTWLTGNQSITWTGSGDASGSASGTTSISPTLTNAALQANIKTFSSSITVSGVGGVTVNQGVAASTLALVNATSANTLTISTASTGINIVSVSSIVAVNQQDYILNLGSTTTSTLLLTNSGNVISSGTVPTVSSCGTGSPSVNGTNVQGTITMGTGSPTACTLTFANNGYVNIPTCVCSPNAGVACGVTSASTTAVTFTIGVTETSINYICLGNKG